MTAPAGLHVLLVEDNFDCAHLMVRLLARLGHQVDHAEDGAAALAEALVHPPDVVLLDIGLPDMDGYEVAARLRSQTGPKRPFIIAVSGGVSDEEARQAAGIDLHLVKPVEPEELRQVLERFGRVTQGARAEARP